MGDPGDSDLVSRARNGDKNAFEQLLRPMVGPAARLAYGMLQERTAAEDAVQEAALKAWRRLRNVKAGGAFGPWFLGIVANQCRSFRRTRWSSVLRFEHPLRAEATPTADSTVQAADLRRALLRLPPDQRAAILLHFYLDLPLETVAVSLGIGVSGVKSRINRGLKRMRPSLQSYEAVV